MITPHQAYSIYKQDGLSSLLKKSARYARLRLNQIVFMRFGKIYWDRKGPVELEIDGATATFGSGPYEGDARGQLRREREHLLELVSTLEGGDVFFDVGANIGLYSCFAVNKLAGSGGEVFAFEPFPPNSAQLEKNLTLNEQNWEVHEVALSDVAGETEFSRSPDAGGNLIGLGAVGFDPTPTADQFTVQTIPADRLISSGDIPTPNVVKIDVEGAAPLVIQGMKGGLKSKECRVLFCEIHPPNHHPSNPSIEDFGMSLPEFQREIESLGFQIEYIRDRNGQKHLKATK